MNICFWYWSLRLVLILKIGFSTNPYVIFRQFDRSAPLGTGIYKVGGNYAASLRANKMAHDLGYTQ